jgi:hypothetical protein
MDREEEIRLIAYEIWQKESCCQGRNCEHWVRAELIWENRNKEQDPAKKTEVKKARKTRKKTVK